jgi:putative ABC transport system permease protein
VTSRGGRRAPAPGARGGRAWRAWIAVWLRAYPRRFRREFGDDLAAQYPAPPHRRARAAITAAADLVRGGVGARRDEAGRNGAGLSALTRGFASDVRDAVRRLRRRPAATLTVVATLAIASGLNVAVFGIVDQTLLRPLPYPREHEIVSIGNEWTGFTHASLSLPEFVDVRDRARTLGSVAVYSNTTINLDANGGEAERVQAARATASLFDVLSVPPAAGRVYTEAEDRAAAQVVVLSDRFWRRRFGADPDIIGRRLTTHGGSLEVIGVMPASFSFPMAETDAWAPMGLNPASPGARGSHNRRVIARMAEGVTLLQAQDELRRVARDIATAWPDSYPPGSGFTMSVMPLRDRLVGDARTPLLILLTAAACVLLLACANVASLVVVRASAERRALATRSALGASRARLVRQALSEGTLAGSLAGVAGAGLAWWLTKALTPWLPADIPAPAGLGDVRLLTFALASTSAAGALAWAIAAMRTTRLPVSDALHAGRSAGDAPTDRLRQALTGLQIAAAVALLAASAIAIRGFARLVSVDPGVTTAGVVTARVSLATARYPDGARRTRFYDDVIDRLVSTPGVRAAGAVSFLPLTGQTNDWVIGIEGFDAPAGVTLTEQSRVVQGGYFSALGIPIIEGRPFGVADGPTAPRVAIVSAAMARKYWAGESPIGRRVRRWGLTSDEPWTTIVGVVGDVRHVRLDQPAPPFIYYPASQLPEASMTVVASLEAAGGAAGRGPRVIADAVRSVDPNQPVWSQVAMDAWFDRLVSAPRFSYMLLALFASVAMAIAAVGIYSVTSFAVARRTREIGIRVALGAQPRALLRSVLAGMATLAGAATLAGGLAGLAAGRALGAVFPDVRLADPVVFAGVPALAFAIALLASYLPARRALRIDPLAALRSD